MHYAKLWISDPKASRRFDLQLLVGVFEPQAMPATPFTPANAACH